MTGSFRTFEFFPQKMRTNLVLSDFLDVVITFHVLGSLERAMRLQFKQRYACLK